ncbi:ADP-ribose diphosphatase [Aliiglaciecola sp. CAU 1673]|uniref:ADP-ribose diphosphatase n=1 Tax=Aliiglaciecola sp. CAU 1673 TaxID=3032595 RepID=UPI0023DBEBE8|nr:ADP-ribose diphosphatase [Aliiglaciecola sp. CAU 1673]MDF2180382.1 ADP-ribose diphosphatase [Aliiglaciecola sp. CAU 1673]
MVLNKRFDSKDVEILAKEPLYKGFFTMLKYRFRHRLFAGGWSGEIHREIFERGHAVAMLPYDPVLDEVVLIEQFRAGALATSEYPWLLECVAGIIDPGETAEQVCRREAMEEAGLKIHRLQPMLSYLSSPGGTTERLYLYIGECDASNAEGIHGLDSENEDIRVHRFKADEALQFVQNGRVDNAATLIALQWFALNKSTLVAQWQSDKS